ncbi:MAG: 50S ribosomal protein L25, partial [bacterium]|nr:50S ribosomal protein L25 [bacterium]
MITLEVRKREKKENPKKLRAGGFIPAVFYGPQEEATPIAIKEPDFLKVWSEAGGSTIVDLM